MPTLQHLLLVFLFCCPQEALFSTDYYVHPQTGNDAHSGRSAQLAFQTLERASRINFRPGDRLLLASGETYSGSLKLIGQHGDADRAITITTVALNGEEDLVPALIDFKGQANGILLKGSSFVQLSNIRLRGEGYSPGDEMDYSMRCGVLITNKVDEKTGNIRLDKLKITDVFFENVGFTRGENEVRTANGTQRYGWGVRIINQDVNDSIEAVAIENCLITNVSHTGIKLTGRAKNIRHINLTGNEVYQTGGPGIQMSGVQDVYVRNNKVSYSGSKDDGRKWGRGSGLWTWGSSRVLIERNAFLHANGPGDSAGAHIDFNCDNIILQYNLSAHNAGGFCEVLGNTYNCAYRYNVSINDGFRIKGVDGAFQEGKVFWLSGYRGRGQKRKGPENFYFYNNTIYCDASLVAKIAIDKSTKSVLIANNIFYLKAGAKSVLGDQYKPDKGSDQLVENLVFWNNLFLDQGSWPSDAMLKDERPRFGDPGFRNAGGVNLEDYVPQHTKLIKRKGIVIRQLSNDSLGLWQPLRLATDILGHPLKRKPSIGAIEPFY
ncbi:MAG: right-handed parallel beta-helix repeat-containing protein [Lewinella sp.]